MQESAANKGRPGVALAAVAAACTLAIGVTVGTLVALADGGEQNAKQTEAAPPIATPPAPDRVVDAAPAAIVEAAPDPAIEGLAAAPRRHHAREDDERHDDDDHEERDDDD